MSDLMNEERNEKIRKQWLEVIETNESLFANLLKKENLPSEKLLEIEKRQKEGQELKKRINALGVTLIISKQKLRELRKILLMTLN